MKTIHCPASDRAFMKRWQTLLQMAQLNKQCTTCIGLMANVVDSKLLNPIMQQLIYGLVTSPHHGHIPRTD